MTDEIIEKMAEQAIEKIRNGKIKTSFILKKKMNAVELIQDLTGRSIVDQENVYYFWNIVGASLAYVKPRVLEY